MDVVLNFDGSGPLLGVGLGIALTSGKVALANNATQGTGPTASNVLYFVGYGLANQYEGSGAAPSPQAGTGILAVNDPYSSSPPYNFIKNSLVKNNKIMFSANVKDLKIYSLSGQLIKTSSVKANDTLDVAELQKGTYIITGTVNDKQVSQKILKD